MSDTTKHETTPDELMEHFRGSSLKTIISFTVLVHAVLLLGTSIPFLKKQLTGVDTSKMTEEEKIASAVREARESLDKIAKEHGLNAADISGQFAGGAKPSRAPSPTAPATPETPATSAGDTTPEEPKTEIEKELEVKKEGPALPTIEDDDEEDLFK